MAVLAGARGSARDGRRPEQAQRLGRLARRDVPRARGCGGAAAGAGCSLALACDVVYAGSQAVFSLPFFKIALLPDTGASYFIVKQLGYKKAFELFSGNASLKAKEAEVCHLINHVIDEQELEEACFNYCLKLSQEQSENLGNLKALLQAAETETLAEILNLEAYYQDQAAKAPTFEQAIKHFKERK